MPYAQCSNWHVYKWLYRLQQPSSLSDGAIKTASGPGATCDIYIYIEMSFFLNDMISYATFGQTVIWEINLRWSFCYELLLKRVTLASLLSTHVSLLYQA
jgi:hypothetical protein